MMLFFTTYKVPTTLFVSIFLFLYLFNNRTSQRELSFQLLEKPVNYSAENKLREKIIREIEREQERLTGRVKFEFSLLSVETLEKKSDTVSLFKMEQSILCKLTNTTTDTIYHIVHSCPGYNGQLEYDVNKFVNYRIHSCCVSFPIKEKIPPNGTVEFYTNLVAKDSANLEDLRLGYYLKIVPDTFDIKIMEDYYIPLNNQNNPSENVIWAN